MLTRSRVRALLRPNPQAARFRALRCFAAASLLGALTLWSPAAAAGSGTPWSYELISPPDDLAYNAFPLWQAGEGVPKPRYAQDWLTRSGADADSHTYYVKLNKIGIPGIAPDNQASEILLSRRTLTGWPWTSPLADRTDCGSNTEIKYNGTASDGRHVAIGFSCPTERERFSPRNPDGVVLDQNDTGSVVDFTASGSLYRVDYQTGSYEYLTGKYGENGEPVIRSDMHHNYFIGGSADFDVVYFATAAALIDGIGDAPTNALHVYRHSRGRTELVTRTATGTAAPVAVNLVPNSLDRVNGLVFGGAEASYFTYATTTALVADDLNGVRDVYRLGQGGSVEWISKPSRTAVPPEVAADRVFEGADKAAKRIYLSSLEKMTNDDLDTRRDIYVADQERGLARVSVSDSSCEAVVPNPCNDNASVVTAAQHSDAHFAAAAGAGNVVAFVSGDVLHPSDADGTMSLYVRDIERSVTHYIAPAGHGRTTATNGTDAGTATVGSLVKSTNPQFDWRSQRPIEVSEDGRTIAFLLASNTALPAGRGGVVSDGVRDLYVWRADVGLRRVQEGLQADDNSSDASAVPAVACWAVAPVVGTPTNRGPCRGITRDGEYVLINTTHTLIPEDTDGGFRDVYMLRTSDGRIELVSPPGSDPAGAIFSEMSPDGRRVFFTSRETLDASRDLDGGLTDMYVATRDQAIGPARGVEPGCSGDACQPPPGQRFAPLSSSSQALSVPSVVAPVAPTRRALQLRMPTRGTARAAARTGVLRAHVRLAGGGTVRVRAAARVGGQERTIGVATRRIVTKRAVTVSTTMRLSAAARSALRRGEQLTVTLSAQATAIQGVRRVRFRLESPNGGATRARSVAHRVADSMGRSR